MKKRTQSSKSQLSQQLLSSFGASLVVIGIATFSFAYISLRRNLEQHVQQRAEGITQGLEFASEGLIETQDVYLIERLVQNYATMPAVIEVSIVAPDGIVLAHSNVFEINTIKSRRYGDLHPNLVTSLQQASHNGIETNIRTVLQGKTVVVQMLPFTGTLFDKIGHSSPALTKHRGVAIAVMDLEKIEQEALRSTPSLVLVITVSAALILLFMGWLIQRLILLPLAQITLAITQSEHQGNFSLPTLPNNEIGFLGTTFVSVFEQLKAYKQRELEIAERKYEEIAQRYELATRATKVWVWDWNIETDTFLLDRRLQQWLNYINLELPCQFDAWVNMIYIDDRDLFLNALHTHLEGKTLEFSCEHRLFNVDGTPHWFLSQGQAVRDRKGKAFRAIGTITDITERKQAEAKLQQTNQELIRATRLKDEFLANMSHELRTPLNAILGMAEGLQEEVFGTVNERQLKALQTVERSGSHLLLLINDILDVAKIESGQIELNCTPTAVAPLCQSSLAFIQQQALKKRIQLQIKLPLDLPDLLVDERRIRQVLINLLNNAVKFTPDGGRITLEVSRQQHYAGPDAAGFPPKNYLRIATIDTGIGIAPENIKKLFEPFIQVDSALNRQYQGTGLGLVLVKRIVELHGGRVELTSELGVGSCFTIELPCSPLSSAIAADESAVAAPELDSPAASEAVNQGPLILLAEDNEANISTLSSYLGAKGYRILLAKDGQAAIDTAATYQPDLILMDIQMPVKDGLEAIREIRLDLKLVDIPIIALTALAMTSDRDRCLEAGANYYLSKPVKLKQLATTIQQILVGTKDNK